MPKHKQIYKPRKKYSAEEKYEYFRKRGHNHSLDKEKRLYAYSWLRGYRRGDLRELDDKINQLKSENDNQFVLLKACTAAERGAGARFENVKVSQDGRRYSAESKRNYYEKRKNDTSLKDSEREYAQNWLIGFNMGQKKSWTDKKNRVQKDMNASSLLLNNYKAEKRGAVARSTQN